MCRTVIVFLNPKSQYLEIIFPNETIRFASQWILDQPKERKTSVRRSQKCFTYTQPINVPLTSNITVRRYFKTLYLQQIGRTGVRLSCAQKSCRDILLSVLMIVLR